MSSLITLLFAIALLWVFGYLVVDLFARGYFRPRVKEAAVSFIVGPFLAGFVVFPVLRSLSDAVWFDRALTWTVPFLVVILAAIWVLRRRRQIVGAQGSAGKREARLPSGRQVLPLASAAVIILGAGLMVAFRPGKHPDAVLELYGSRSQNRVSITVNSTGSDPEDYIIVISTPNFGPAAYPLTDVSTASGPQSIEINGSEAVSAELFRADQNPQQDEPIRWLSVPSLNQSG